MKSKICIFFHDDVERDFIAACLAVSNLGILCEQNKKDLGLIQVGNNVTRLKNITGERVMSLFGALCEDDEMFEGARDEWRSFIKILKKDGGLHESWKNLLPIINKYRELNIPDA